MTTSSQPSLQPPLSSSSQLFSGSNSSLGNSTTVITTDKKRFVIEDVSFNGEDNFGDSLAQEGKGSTKGGQDSETASQCGGLESASTNSMQSDSNVQQDSNPYLQTDNGMHQFPSTGHASTSSQPNMTAQGIASIDDCRYYCCCCYCCCCCYYCCCFVC